MKKAPTREDFEYDFPNVGYDVGKYARAAQKWIKEAEEYIKKLEHYRDTTVGLWATDKPKRINDHKEMLFEIKY